MGNIANKTGIIHYDKILSNYASDYKSQSGRFIGDMLAGSIVVDKQSDFYNVYSANGKYDLADSRRAPGAEANLLDNLTVTQATYGCLEYALKVQTRWQDRSNSDVKGAEKKKVDRMMEALLLQKEQAMATLAFTAANFGSNTAAATNKWDTDDYSTVDPRIVVWEKMREIESVCGVRPNTLTINNEVADGLARSPFITSIMPEGNWKNISAETLQTFFKVEKVLIGSSYKNTSNEGQTKSMSALWGNHCLLSYSIPGAGIDDPSTFKVFNWNGEHSNMAGRGISGVRVFADEKKKITEYETEMNYDYKLTFADSAYLITDVIS